MIDQLPDVLGAIGILDLGIFQDGHHVVDLLLKFGGPPLALGDTVAVRRYVGRQVACGFAHLLLADRARDVGAQQVVDRVLSDEGGDRRDKAHEQIFEFAVGRIRVASGEAERSRVKSTPLRSLMMIKIWTTFKEVNDTLGHQVGDLLLQQIARVSANHGQNAVLEQLH